MVYCVRTILLGVYDQNVRSIAVRSCEENKRDLSLDERLRDSPAFF